MYQEEKMPCPNCKEKTIPKLWLGIDPPVCGSCGHQEKKPKLMC
jgi:hypothetical protein